ncbi:MAG: SCO family protein [Parvularculaceae bacterium]
MTSAARWKAALAAGGLAATLLAGCGGEDPPAAGVIALSDQFSSDFNLVDHNGERRSDEDFRGKVMFVYFGFATCPDVCPLALGRMTGALEELKPGELDDVQPLFITVDPERDTPEKLEAYLSFDERILGLTGDLEAAEAARRSFKTFAEKRPLPESELGYTMDHYSLFYLVDRDGQPRVALKDSMTPAEIAASVRRALRWR